MHFENNDEFVTKDWRIWFKRLGAEATAGAIADMLWKSQRRTNYMRLFGTNLISFETLSSNWYNFTRSRNFYVFGTLMSGTLLSGNILKIWDSFVWDSFVRDSFVLTRIRQLVFINFLESFSPRVFLLQLNYDCFFPNQQKPADDVSTHKYCISILQTDFL